MFPSRVSAPTAKRLTAWVAARPISGGLVAAVGYALVVAFSLPIASLMTLVVGFLFGQIWGTVIVVAGATAGALAVFTAARSALAAVCARAPDLSCAGCKRAFKPTPGATC